jgi:glycosyltransferase involved in cell wall biosynthesis
MKPRKKIIYILSHPIQYYSPLFKYIHESATVDCEVWYLSMHGVKEQVDHQFGVAFQWDIPLLEGYPYRFLKNNSLRPGVYNGFFGIFNWQILGMMARLPAKSILIVPGWNSLSYAMAIIFGRLFGHQVCMRGDPPYNQELLKSRLSKVFRFIAFRGVLFPCISRFLYVGIQNKNFYQYYGIKKERLIPAPHAVDNAFFIREKEKLAPQRKALRDALHIPDEDKVVLFCGKLISKKNPMDLLEAFRRLPVEINATLLLVGEGELRNELESHIEKYQVKKVIITGFINQSRIAEYYTVADIFVMCSGIGETWGLSTNEAMNFELPLLISDLTGNAVDLVKNNGYVFKTKDIDDLYHHLFILLTTAEGTLRNMGKVSFSIVQQYSYGAIVNGLATI